MSGKFWRGAAASHGYNLAGAGLIELDIRVMFNHYMDTTDFMVPAPAGDVFFYCPVNCLQHVHYQRKRNGHHGKAYFLPRLHGGNTAGQNGAVFSAGAGNYWDHAAGGDIRLRRGLARLGVQLLINAVILVSCALSAATLISTVTYTQQQAMMAGVLVLMPAILLSGVFFPVANIPAVFRWMCYFNPLMYATANFRNVILKGGDWLYFWQYAAVAAAMALLLAYAAYKNFKAKLN